MLTVIIKMNYNVFRIVIVGVSIMKKERILFFIITLVAMISFTSIGFILFKNNNEKTNIKEVNKRKCRYEFSSKGRRV